MIIIGLTGVIGSGKSSAAKYFRKHGFPVIDMDALAKESLTWEETQNDIRRVFGDDVINEGKIDTVKLSAIVFREKDALRTLESIVHPKVRGEVNRRLKELEQQGAHAVVLDHPLLFETKTHLLVDKIVVVSTDQDNILKRLQKRGVQMEEAHRRLSFQMPLSEKEAKADYIIDNNGTEEQLEKNLDSLLETIMKWEEKADASQ